MHIYQFSAIFISNGILDSKLQTQVVHGSILASTTEDCKTRVLNSPNVQALRQEYTLWDWVCTQVDPSKIITQLNELGYIIVKTN